MVDLKKNKTKQNLRLPGLRNRKNEKKKEDTVLKDTIKYPNICKHSTRGKDRDNME